MDLLPKDHSQFKEESYWRKVYEHQDSDNGFEWYASYSELEFYLKHAFKNPEARVLVVGCGNSLLSE